MAEIDEIVETLKAASDLPEAVAILIAALEESRKNERDVASKIQAAILEATEQGRFFKYNGFTIEEWIKRAEDAEKQLAANSADASWARVHRSKHADCENALRKAEAELATLKAQESPAEAWRRGYQLCMMDQFGLPSNVPPYTPPAVEEEVSDGHK